MPKQIFQDNREGYADAVERLAYNKNYGWKDRNSVNFSLSAMVFNSGQFVEMDRDQEHALEVLYAEEADKTALAALVEQARQIPAQGQQGYSQESLEAFTGALERAAAILKEDAPAKFYHL